MIILDNEDGDLDEDTVMMDALDCGAADFEPEEDCFTIYTEPDDCGKVASCLRGEGLCLCLRPGGNGTPELCEAH